MTPRISKPNEQQICYAEPIRDKLHNVISHQVAMQYLNNNWTSSLTHLSLYFLKRL